MRIERIQYNKSAGWNYSELPHLCTWRISPILENSPLSSACCQTFFPTIIRPKNRLWELILEFSLILQKWTAPSSARCKCCEWRSRYVTLFDTSKSEKDYFPGSISLPVLLPTETIHGEEPANSLLFGSAFAFERHEMHILRNELQQFPARCCSYSSQTSLIHEKFWPKNEYCLCSRHDSDHNSMFTVQITSCNFQYGPHCGVPLSPSFRLQMLLRLLAECTHDEALHETVWDLKCLSSRNTVHSQQHLEIMHPYKIYSLFHSVKDFSFVLQLVAIENSDTLDRHSPKEVLSWSYWEQLIVPSLYQMVLIYREGIHILHKCFRLLRKDWAHLQKQFAPNRLNRFQIGCKVYWQFSMSFAFDSTTGQWARSTENWTSSIGEFNTIFSARVYQTPCGVSSSDRVPLLLSIWTNEWPLSNTKLLCKCRDDLSVCQTFFFVIILLTRSVVERRNKEKSCCERFWCFS